MKLRIFFIVCGFVLFGCKAYAQISFKTEYLGSSSFSLDKDEDSPAKIGNSKGSAVIYHGDINLPLSTTMNKNARPILWGMGLSGTYASLNNKNLAADFVLSDMLNLGLGIYHMRPIGRKWSLRAGIGVGVYTSSTDLSKIRAKQLLCSGSLLFICQIRPNFKLGGGVAVNSTFGYPMAFPALYLNWALHGKVDFMLSMTNGLNISAGLQVSKFMKVSLIGEMNGQMALLKRAGKDVIFSHQYIVIGLRPEFRLGKKVSIPITAGVSAIRSANFSDRTLKAMFKSKEDHHFQSSLYLSAGITLNFK